MTQTVEQALAAKDAEIDRLRAREARLVDALNAALALARAELKGE